MAAGGHTVLRLSPYESDLKHTELIWVSVKWREGRSNIFGTND